MKAGLFAGALELLVAAKKLVVLGAIGLGAIVAGWLRSRRRDHAE